MEQNLTKQIAMMGEAELRRFVIWFTDYDPSIIRLALQQWKDEEHLPVQRELLPGTQLALKNRCPRCGAEPGKICTSPHGNRLGSVVHFARRGVMPPERLYDHES